MPPYLYLGKGVNSVNKEKLNYILYICKEIYLLISDSVCFKKGEKMKPEEIRIGKQQYVLIDSTIDEKSNDAYIFVNLDEKAKHNPNIPILPVYFDLGKANLSLNGTKDVFVYKVKWKRNANETNYVYLISYTNQNDIVIKTLMENSVFPSECEIEMKKKAKMIYKKNIGIYIHIKNTNRDTFSMVFLSIAFLIILASIVTIIKSFFTIANISTMLK